MSVSSHLQQRHRQTFDLWQNAIQFQMGFNHRLSWSIVGIVNILTLISFNQKWTKKKRAQQTVHIDASCFDICAGNFICSFCVFKLCRGDESQNKFCRYDDEVSLLFVWISIARINYCNERTHRREKWGKNVICDDQIKGDKHRKGMKLVMMSFRQNASKKNAVKLSKNYLIFCAFEQMFQSQQSKST